MIFFLTKIKKGGRPIPPFKNKKFLPLQFIFYFFFLNLKYKNLLGKKARGEAASICI